MFKTSLCGFQPLSRISIRFKWQTINYVRNNWMFRCKWNGIHEEKLSRMLFNAILCQRLWLLKHNTLYTMHILIQKTIRHKLGNCSVFIVLNYGLTPLMRWHWRYYEDWFEVMGIWMVLLKWNRMENGFQVSSASWIGTLS